MCKAPQAVHQAVRHLDGLEVIGIVVIEVNYLNMCAEARHFLRHRVLKTDHDADGHNHHHHAHNDARQGYADGRTRMTLFAFLRKIQAFRYV